MAVWEPWKLGHEGRLVGRVKHTLAWNASRLICHCRLYCFQGCVAVRPAAWQGFFMHTICMVACMQLQLLQLLCSAPTHC